MRGLCPTLDCRYGHGTAAKSGGSNATRVAIYGDMGNDAGNNMGNLRTACASGTIDAVVHMGDHAYNMGNGNDYHGDAYVTFPLKFAHSPPVFAREPCQIALPLRVRGATSPLWWDIVLSRGFRRENGRNLNNLRWGLT